MDQKERTHLEERIRRGDVLSESERELIADLLKGEHYSTTSALPEAVIRINNLFLDSADWKEELNESFRILSATVNLSSAVCFHFQPLGEQERLQTNRLAEWHAPGQEQKFAKIVFTEEVTAELQKELKHSSSFLTSEESCKRWLPDSFLERMDNGENIILPILKYSGVTAFLMLSKVDGEWKPDEVTALERMVIHLSGVVEKQHKLDLLESGFKQAGIGTWEMNLEKDEYYWSPETRRIFEMPPDREITSDLLRTLFTTREDWEKVSDAIRSSAGFGMNYDFEMKVNTAKGNVKWIRDTGRAESVDGKVVRIYGTVQDIDTQKRLEQKLMDAEQKLRDVVENSTNLFYTHTTDHRLIYVSPQSKHFFASDPEEAKIKWTHFLTDHPANDAGVQSTERAIQTGERQPPFELQLRRMDGTIIWVEVNEAPILKEGKTVAVVGSLTDITDRKRAENQLRRSLKEKETLLSEIHHRVKNNLAVVAGMLQIQAMNSANEELNEQLMESVLRIKSMAAIHEKLYQSSDFSRLDFAENLETLLTSIINAMQHHTKLSVSFECDPVLLSVTQAIPFSLILNEVVTNIIKHAYPGRESGEIRVSLKETGDQVIFRLADDGEGLPDDFDPDNTSTLGMQLINTLTSQLRGEFEYVSEGKGCEFILQFRKRMT